MGFLTNKAIIILTIRSLGAVLALGLQITLARILGTDEYGIYAFVISWITVITLFTSLGFDTSLAHYLPRYMHNAQWGSFSGIIRSSFRITLIASCVLAALTLIILLGTDDFDAKTAFIYALPLISIITMSNIRAASLRSLKRYASAVFPETILKPLLIIGGLLSFLIMGKQLSALSAIVIQLIAAAVTLGVGIYLLRKTLHGLSTPARPEYHTHDWLKTSLPMLLTSTSAYIISQTDIIMLGLLQDMAQSGIYSAVSRISEAAVFFMAAINFVSAPLVSEAYQQGDRERLSSIVRTSTRISTALSLIVWTIFLLFGEDILEIFGADFMIGYTALIILTFGHFINTAAGPVGVILSMSGRQLFTAKVMLSCAALNLVLNYFLIPEYGLQGAAVSTMTSTFLWNAVLLLKVNQTLEINASIFGGSYYDKG